MDILQPRDSLSSEDHIFFSSDEFMVELLTSNAQKEALETIEKNHLLNNNSNNNSKDRKQFLSPSREKKKDLREHLEKAGSFSSKFSGGVTCKPTPPQKQKPKVNEKDNKLFFRKASSKKLRNSSSTSEERSTESFVTPESSKKPALDLTTRSLPTRNTRSESFDMMITPESSKPSLDFSMRSLQESMQSEAVPPPPTMVQEAKSWDNSSSDWSCDTFDQEDEQNDTTDLIESTQPHPPLQQIMPSISDNEDDDDEDIYNEDDVPLPPPPPPPPPPMSYAPYSKKDERRSASARMERSYSPSPPSPLSKSTKSHHTKRLSFQVNNCGLVSPPPASLQRHRSAPSPSVRHRKRMPETKKAEKRTSWIVPVIPTPPTPRSRSGKGSSRSSSNSKRSSITAVMPKMPVLARGESLEEEEEEPSPMSRRNIRPNGPPLFRPLDKTLMRDYPSSTTATTFLTADTDAVDYSMTAMFPITKETERIVLKKAPNKRDLIIETPDGERMGSIDYSMVNQGRRLIKDSCGKTCALIFLQPDKSSNKNIFKICGNKPASRKQRLSNETGYYTWAEVKNSGSLGGKFVMNRFCAETSSCSAEQHCTKPFGGLFSRGGRGYSFLDDSKKECVKMVNLRKGKGIIVGPNRDLCLYLAYAVCVDEMLEQRLR